MTRASVLCDTYQHAPFIADCIRSVLAQTTQGCEMIIVDAGSEDGTPDIAKSFQDPRVVVLRRQHEGAAGLGSAYALAVAGTHSRFPAILDGEDTWPPTELEDELPLFSDPTVVLAYGAAELMDEKSDINARLWHSPRGRFSRIAPVEVTLPHLLGVNFIVAVTVIVRRSDLVRIGDFIQHSDFPYVDHSTWLRMATNDTFDRTSLVLGHWRRHARQVTTRSWFESNSDRVPHLQATAANARDVMTSNVIAALTAEIQRDSSRQHEEALNTLGRLEDLEGNWREAAATFVPLEDRRAKNPSNGCGWASVRWKPNRRGTVNQCDGSPFSAVAPALVSHCSWVSLG
jgi:hypothetical protein